MNTQEKIVAGLGAAIGVALVGVLAFEYGKKKGSTTTTTTLLHGPCPAGQLHDSVTGLCVPACWDGSAPRNGTCPAHLVPPVCPPGQVRDTVTGACVAPCPGGGAPANGVCAGSPPPPPPTTWTAVTPDSSGNLNVPAGKTFAIAIVGPLGGGGVGALISQLSTASTTGVLTPVGPFPLTAGHPPPPGWPSQDSFGMTALRWTGTTQQPLVLTPPATQASVWFK